MAIQIKVPAVGESITEVTIANWLKKDGDVVKVDEVIAELESDKASFELPASSGGVLKILKQKGETVPIGEAICEIEPSEQAASTAPPANAPAAAATTQKGESPKPSGSSGVKEMKVPAVGESITEVTISTWLKKEGDFVKLDEVIAEVESDKATFELPAEANGILHIVAKEKEILPIGGLICKIEMTEVAPVTEPSAKQETVIAAGGGDKTYAAGHPSPAAAKI